MDALSPGTRLGRYLLDRLLGQGAMGQVWAAELHGPRGFRKPVALKVLRGRSGPPRTEMLLREARLGALLHHPNVVSVHALEEHAVGWVMVMERVEGASVLDLCRSRALPPRCVLDIGAQAAAGLAHIHALEVDGEPARLVHRDIKPANLLVDRTGVVKVADLGVAAVSGTGPVMGTPGYAPPEQLAGRAEARSDLFALAVTLYVAATGSGVPFGNLHRPDALVELIEARLRDEGLIGRIDHAVAGLGDVLRRCFCADPDQRWADALQLGAALAALRTAQPAGRSLRSLLVDLRPDLGPGPPSTLADLTETTLLGRGNLPAAHNAFFGRGEEVAALRQRLQGGTRPVTILGPGGMGKTRLALRAAGDLQHVLPGGAWFVDCAEATTVDGICAAVGVAMALPLERNDPVQQIGWAMRNRGHAVFVFDNLEQCVEPATRAVARWVEMAPDARVLCTSRIRLGLPDEQLLRLGPLPIDEGEALFVDRSAVQVPDAHRAAVRGLVEAVDGMPLAIELAAARMRLMPAPVLRERLQLRLLSGVDRDRPARHRSVEASLAWSWDLLPPSGRAALSELSVFDGGFTLEAAEAVLRADEAGEWAADRLQELVDASLVRVDPETGRFSLLGVVQQFGAERLVAAEQVEARHGAWFAQLREQAAHVEIDNLVAGLHRAVARVDGRTAVGCAIGAWAIVEVQGPLAIAVPLLESALAIAPEALRPAVTLPAMNALCRVGRISEAAALGRAALDLTRASGDVSMQCQLLRGVGYTEERLGEVDAARASYVEGLALARRIGDRPAERGLLGALGYLDMLLVRLPEAAASLEAALAIQEELPDRRASGWLLNLLGAVRHGQGQVQAAGGLYARALAVHRELGHKTREATVMGNLASWHHRRGSIAQAEMLYEAALRRHRQVGNRNSEGVVLSNHGYLLRDLGQLDAAMAAFEAGLEADREVGNRYSEAVAVGSIARLHADRGRFRSAVPQLHAAIALHEAVGNRRSAAICREVLGDVHLAQGHHDEAAAWLERALSELVAVGVPRQEAVVRGRLGALARASGQPDDAASLLQQAIEGHLAVENPSSAARDGFELTRAHLDRDDLGAAERALADATVHAEGLPYPQLVLRQARARAAVCCARGEVGAAREALGEAERVARALDDRAQLAWILCEAAPLEKQPATRLDEAGALARALEVAPNAPLWLAIRQQRD